MVLLHQELPVLACEAGNQKPLSSGIVTSLTVTNIKQIHSDTRKLKHACDTLCP